MSAERKDGGPAFPTSDGIATDGDKTVDYHSTFPGMSLRDWFAGHASEKDIEQYRSFWRDDQLVLREREAARYAYADAMLAERAKP